MHSAFVQQRRVEFCETDAAGIAHFSAFFQYMEQAEHAFWRHLGLSVHWSDADGPISWPRVSAHCDYVSAVRFEHVLDIVVRVDRVGEKSVTFGFEFSLGGRDVAKGSITAVCCRVFPNQPPCAIPIPDWIAARLRNGSPS